MPSGKYNRATVEEIDASGPALHQYPGGFYVVRFVGENKRGRRAVLKWNIGKVTEERALAAFERWKAKHAKANGAPHHLPVPAEVLRAARRTSGEPRRRDTGKAVLGLVAAHLLQTLAHTVKILQEDDE